MYSTINIAINAVTLIFLMSIGAVLWCIIEDFITYHSYKRRAEILLNGNCEKEEEKRELMFLALRCFRNSQYSYFHKEQHKELLKRLQNHIKKTEKIKN